MVIELSRRSRFSDLAPNTQKVLRRLTVRGWLLRQYIDSDPENLFTNIAYYRGKIVGWMGIYQGLAMFYVRPEFRRSGIGTVLASRVNRKKHKYLEGVRGSDQFFQRCRMQHQ